MVNTTENIKVSRAKYKKPIMRLMIFNYSNLYYIWEYEINKARYIYAS